MKWGVVSSRTTAFLARSIRQESRLLYQHVLRGALCAVILGLLLVQLSASVQFNAAGRTFANMILEPAYWFLTVVGLLYFSVAITEEKEEETLPLLRMTGVSNAALLMGKSLPRLALTILFLLVITPFLTLTITMGGVIFRQLAAAVLGLLTYSFLLSQAGLLCSTIAPDSRRAFSLALVMWITLELGCYLIMAVGYSLDRNQFGPLVDMLLEAASWVQERTLFHSMSIYRMLDASDSLWSPQMTWHVLGGLFFLGLSWLLFERFNLQAIAQGSAPPSVPGVQRASGKQRKPARPSGNALVWKSWQFLVGGRRQMILSTIGLPLLSVVIVFGISVLAGELAPMEAYASVMMTIGVVALLISLARTLGRVLNDEIAQKTLVSLKLIPVTTRRLVGPMVLGSLPAAAAPVCCFVCGLLLLFMAAPREMEGFMELWIEPWFLHLFTWTVLTLHLGVLLSVHMRYGGMVVAAAILWIAAPILFGFFTMTVGFMFSGIGYMGEEILRYLLPLSMSAGECGLCIVMQKMILKKVDQLAEQ